MQGLTVRPYEKSPSAIYEMSFATVRREARLDRFGPGMEDLAIRLIHACGMVEVADRLDFSANAFAVGHAALRAGAPVLCDCEMVGAGIIRRYLPCKNEVVVTLNDPRERTWRQNSTNCSCTQQLFRLKRLRTSRESSYSKKT